MQVLTATQLTQGHRINDFYWCTDGELVCYPVVCCDADPDGGCGCSRSWSGVDSRKGTTTALVTRSMLTRKEYIERVVASNVRSWGASIEPEARRDAAKLLRLAASHPEGTVLEIRGAQINPRDINAPSWFEQIIKEVDE